MSRFEKMIQGLQEEIEVPEKVWESYTDTLKNLTEKPGKSVKKRWVSYTAAAAMLCVIGTAFCCANPTLASKIPIVGKIFERVEKDVTFSDDYSKKANVLNTQAQSENQGLTVTASEIYSDGLSVFLTLQVENEQGGFSHLPGNALYLGGTWKLSDSEAEKVLLNNNLEGKIVDDHTFVGMLKLDLEKTARMENTLELCLSMIGYDDDRELAAEEITAFHQIEGNWKFELPFRIDDAGGKTILLNQENNGYCLKNVQVSSSQVIVNVDVPYTKENISWEAYEKAMQEKTGKNSDFPMSFEEYVEEMGKSYEECYTMVFNQEGERLLSREENCGKSVWAVHGMDISKLYIFVVDSFDAWVELKEEGMESPATKQAVLAAEVAI